MSEKVKTKQILVNVAVGVSILENEDATDICYGVAKLTNVRYGVLKMRRLLNILRSGSVERAFGILSVMRTKLKGAPIVEKTLKTAINNYNQARAKKGGTAKAASELKIRAIFADGGPIIKRARPRSHGRAFPIHKSLSHLTVVVSD
ncbi:MAG: uL22 family ribosomal protein [Fibromonadales bacterium]|nr:uL22 family ribosomal protein [Fibromonadales bacterium]